VVPEFRIPGPPFSCVILHMRTTYTRVVLQSSAADAEPQLGRVLRLVGRDERAHSMEGSTERKCPVREHRARGNECVDSD
jgi:hypothetical protein